MLHIFTENFALLFAGKVAQKSFPFFIIGKKFGNERVKRLAVVFMPDVGKLMDDHIVDRLIGIAHEKTGKTQTVIPVAAAETAFCPSYGNSGGRKSIFCAKNATFDGRSSFALSVSLTSSSSVGSG